MKVILATKIGMSQVFDRKGNMIPVTVCEAGPCMVLEIKSAERDGYLAIQLGFGEKRSTKKPLRGHFQKAAGEERHFRWVREFRFDDGGVDAVPKDSAMFSLGQMISVSVFQEGDTVSVSGISKGKGFQGVVKRHGFHGAPATHGTKHAHRQPGSIGSTTPQRVLKGTRMAGRMGSQRTCVKNLKIVKIDLKKNLLAIQGAVPGARGTILEIRG